MPATTGVEKLVQLPLSLYEFSLLASATMQLPIAKISGLKPGIHAIHIHEKSDCTAADGSSAGGHWNPTFKKHGISHKKRYDFGREGGIKNGCFHCH